MLPEHCSNYQGLYCIECTNGYFLNNNQCKSCNEIGIENCAKCNMLKCFKCEERLTLYESQGNDNLIQECIDCSKSENDEKCGRCSLGEYFNVTSFTCKKSSISK